MHIKLKDVDNLYYYLVCDLYQRRFEHAPDLTQAFHHICAIKDYYADVPEDERPTKVRLDVLYPDGEAQKIIEDALLELERNPPTL